MRFWRRPPPGAKETHVMSDAIPRPFGRARLVARTWISRLAAEDCVSPLELFRRLSLTKGYGSVLMESAARGAPAGIRSVVIPQGVVRLIARRGAVRLEPLSSSGRRVLEALARRPGDAGEPARFRETNRGLEARFPYTPADPATPDLERLQTPSVFDSVRALAGVVEDEEPFRATPPGVYGALSYELVDQWEELPRRRSDPFGDPDIHVVLALDTLLFDHLEGKVVVVTRSPAPEDDDEARARHATYIRMLRTAANEAAAPRRPDAPREALPEPTADLSERQFEDAVSLLLEHIRSGEIFQAVLSRGLTVQSGASPLAVYEILRERNPSPYMFYLDVGDGVLLGASPETCVKVEHGDVEIRPIAGTAPRGIRSDGSVDPELDSRLAVGLLLDHKEQAEHAMLLDLARNDVARVSVPGTRRVAGPFSIETYSHVQHLVSRVQGKLLPGLDALHAYRASANMGTLTGAPKLRAMELIREMEPWSRGFYGGAVGYLLQDGTFDSCIVIRSLRYRDGTYATRAGAGIVADSVPRRELEETIHKARACREAVALAEETGS